MPRHSSTYLDLPEAGEVLGVTSRTVYRLIADGLLEAEERVIRGARRKALRVRVDEVDRFKRERDEVSAR